jgi:hypothetical protein
MNQIPSTIAVYGAGGHTGAFVVAELRRRGLPMVAVGRDATRLPPDLPNRSASIDDTEALQRAFAGCSVVINCAGPYLDTADPVIVAALRAHCSYIDLSAEQAATRSVFDTWDHTARAHGRTVIPAVGFYGGLADLLASALVAVAPADEITIAIALDRWWPTAGTRRTGERNRAPRVVVEDGQIVAMPTRATSWEWTFDAPFGIQRMLELPFSEIITITRHIQLRHLRSYLNETALDDVRNPATPPPTAVDAQGRSAQRFAMDVIASGPGGKRRASARGQDIYAVSAPIVVEAAARLLDPEFAHRGALALGQAFDARDFLSALAPVHLAIEFDPDCSPRTSRKLRHATQATCAAAHRAARQG